MRFICIDLSLKMVSTWRRLGDESFRVLYCFCNDYYFYLLLPTILLEPRCASNGVRGFVTTGQSYLALSLLRNYEMRPYSLSRFLLSNSLLSILVDPMKS
jgi:hypothetical protein